MITLVWARQNNKELELLDFSFLSKFESRVEDLKMFSIVVFITQLATTPFYTVYPTINLMTNLLLSVI